MSEKYLLNTPHGWYFRRAVALDVRSFIGKNELKQPLETNCRNEAKKKARITATDKLLLEFQRKVAARKIQKKSRIPDWEYSPDQKTF